MLQKKFANTNIRIIYKGYDSRLIFCLLLFPRILQRDRAVEHQMVGSRILIDIEITDALKLKTIERFHVFQTSFDFAVLFDDE